MQESAVGNEEEQVVALLLSRGAAETALADEMGRLIVQEEVRLCHTPACQKQHADMCCT